MQSNINSLIIKKCIQFIRVIQITSNTRVMHAITTDCVLFKILPEFTSFSFIKEYIFGYY